MSGFWEPDILDLCSLVIRSAEGTFRGTGTLVTPTRILTCAHVVGSLDTVLIGRSLKVGDPISADVKEIGDPEGPLDLALLELKEPWVAGHILRFDHQVRGQEFSLAGWTELRRKQVFGKITGSSSEVDCRIELGTQGRNFIDHGCSGSAVWIQEIERAVGIVTHLQPNGNGLLLPTSEILKFWSGLPAPRLIKKRPLVGTLRTVPNVGLKRFVSLVDRDFSENQIGQGLRVDDCRILTTGSVARSARSISAISAEKSGRRALIECTRYDDKIPQDDRLCLLAASQTKGLELLPAHIGGLPEGTPWLTVVCFADEEGKPQRRSLQGRVAGGSSSADIFRLECESPIHDEEILLSITGAGVFVDVEGNESWKLAGLLQYRTLDSGDGLELLGLRLLEDSLWDRSTDTLHPETREDDERALIRIRRALPRDKDLLEWVKVEHPDWGLREAEDPFKAFAEALISAEPEDLASNLAALQKSLLDDDRLESVDQLFRAMMEALPVAWRKFKEQRLPDASSIDLSVRAFREVLTEIKLASFELGPTVFNDFPNRPEIHYPTAWHRIKPSGEYGPDLGGKAAAGDAFDLATQQVALGRENLSEGMALEMLLGIGTCLNDEGAAILEEPVSAEEQLRLQKSASFEKARQRISSQVNRAVSRPTDRGRRLYYLLAEGDGVSRNQEESILQELRRYLPDLLVVKVQGVTEEDEGDELSNFLYSLRRIFKMRHEALLKLSRRRKTPESKKTQ